MACGNDDCPKMHVRVQVGRQWATGVFHTLADARAFAAGYQHIARTERKARGVVFTVLAGCDNHEIASWRQA